MSGGVRHSELLNRVRLAGGYTDDGDAESSAGRYPRGRSPRGRSRCFRFIIITNKLFMITIELYVLSIAATMASELWVLALELSEDGLVNEMGMQAKYSGHKSSIEELWLIYHLML